MNKENDFLNSAKGPVVIPMTNDYLFRALLQRSNKVLKGLICALLHLSPEQILSAVITNPIELGSSIDDKTFFLDTRIILNNNTVINLEMQVINEHNWPERSLSYLCRAFDNLNSGENYINVKSAIQIGLLDFSLFPDHPEFYSTYEFMNIKNHTIYSDKLCLSVVDLTHINLATEEDKAYRIDYWASLFKAATWEEIKMLAQEDEYIREASDTIYQLTQDEKIRLQCEAREDYYRRQRSVQAYMEQQADIIKQQAYTINEQEIAIRQHENTINQHESTINRQESTINQQENIINQHESTINQQESTINQQENIINQHESTINRQENIIRQQTEQLKKSNSALTEKDTVIARKDSTIASLQAEIERLKNNSIAGT